MEALSYQNIEIAMTIIRILLICMIIYHGMSEEEYEEKPGKKDFTFIYCLFPYLWSSTKKNMYRLPMALVSLLMLACPI